MGKVFGPAALVLLVALAGCGGSGGGDGGGDVTGPGGGGTPVSSDLVVLAWNDLGMHCLSPTYERDVILPPYNNLWVQVISRGDPPRLLSGGVRVEYRLVGNTSSYGKRAYGGFWDHAMELFGVSLAPDTGLNLVDPSVHNGLSGAMLARGDHFEADGIPATPVDDGGVWNPYQVAEITVKDGAGNVIAQTRTTVPTSDEIHCDKCHGQTVAPYLALHDRDHGTDLASRGTAFLCASCHGSPALGLPESPGPWLSRSVHSFHAAVSPTPSCYDCHPGAQTRCNRSLAHTADDGNCTTCHGSLAEVGSSIAGGRIPWGSEPKCASCHDGVPEVDTGATLYRNAVGHGGVRCAGCHGSPHAMVPSREASDNDQVQQYQSASRTLGSCAACHRSSHGDGFSEFGEEHGGSSPRRRSACNVCHTAVRGGTSSWPHAGGWRDRRH